MRDFRIGQELYFGASVELRMTVVVGKAIGVEGVPPAGWGGGEKAEAATGNRWLAADCRRQVGKKDNTGSSGWEGRGFEARGRGFEARGRGFDARGRGFEVRGRGFEVRGRAGREYWVFYEDVKVTDWPSKMSYGL